MTFSEAVLTAWGRYETTGEIQVVFCFLELGDLEEPIYSFCPLSLLLNENEENIVWTLNIESVNDILPLGEVDGTGFDFYDNVD